MTNYLIDSNGTAHRVSTCEFIEFPSIGSCPESALAFNGFPICADCED